MSKSNSTTLIEHMQTDACALSFRLGEKTPSVVRRCLESLSYRSVMCFSSLRLKFCSCSSISCICSCGVSAPHSLVTTPRHPCREALEEDDEHWSIHWRVGNFKTGDWERCLPHQRINHLPKAWYIPRIATSHACSTLAQAHHHERPPCSIFEGDVL